MITNYLSIKKSIAIATLVGFSGGACAQVHARPGSITVAIEPTYNDVAAIHRWLLGESCRRQWAAPVKMRVFHLATEKGGLKILERGGLQTKSLRMQDATG